MQKISRQKSGSSEGGLIHLALLIVIASRVVVNVGIVGVNARTQTGTTTTQPASMNNNRNRRRPPLHNANHESTIRNILQPKFSSRGNPLQSGNHTSNVAIIVSSSRYWFNYRHVTNALSIYHLLKRGGISDDNIVLMLADDIPCNMRNPFRGKIFPRGAQDGMGEDLMNDVEIDYSGTDVTVDAFLRVLLGRHLDGEGEVDGVHRRTWPKMNENTNVMVYLTGHGGDNFFKFQDGEELMSMDVASTFAQMHELKRYNEILFISDTCQAFTMADEIKAPNVYSIGSSLKGQNSYASHSDFEVGQSVIDRYSKIVKDFLDDSVTMTSLSTPEGAVISSTLDNATVAVLERLSLHDALVRIPTMHGDLGPSSKIGHADHLCSRKMTKVPLADFFAAPASERERQMQQREGGIESSLWMNDVVLEEDTQTTGTEQECSIPTLDEVSAGNTNMKQPIQTTGMSPFDPKFVAMVLGFLWCTKVASRIW
eukprot:scaffold1967_cov199-Alexandrium_tamarense.AAC.31